VSLYFEKVLTQWALPPGCFVGLLVLLALAAWRVRRWVAVDCVRAVGSVDIGSCRRAADAIPAPTDFESADVKAGMLFGWLPNAGALERTSRYLKEYLGLIVYAWRGRLASEDSGRVTR
jgi:hypothetical protein